MPVSPLYLDYNATAPLRVEVIALMQTVLAETGNASSIHAHGRAARAKVEAAREKVAALAQTQSPYVTFTSGATEANNAVLQSFRGSRVLVSAIEHPSVIEVLPDAEKVPVTQDGVVDEAALIKLLQSGDSPALLSIMAANNETGVIQPVGRLAKRAKELCPSIHVHCDAVQAAGRIPLDFGAWHLDYLTLSAHKLGGPQGAGALITAPGAKPAKLLHGGGQEKRQRAGTENVAAITGFGLAAELAFRDVAAFQKQSALRDKLETGLKTAAPHIIIHGANAPRLCNTSMFSVPGLSAQVQIMNLDLAGIAVSSGSACSSGTVQPSHVLKAMGASETDGLRISLTPTTKDADIDLFLRVWSDMAGRILAKK